MKYQALIEFLVRWGNCEYTKPLFNKSEYDKIMHNGNVDDEYKCNLRMAKREFDEYKKEITEMEEKKKCGG